MLACLEGRSPFPQKVKNPATEHIAIDPERNGNRTDFYVRHLNWPVPRQTRRDNLQQDKLNEGVILVDSRKVSVSFSLDPFLLKHLDKICQRTKIPRSVLVREGIA